MFFGPFGVAVASLGEQRANPDAFRTFVRFVLVWICRFPLPLGVWEGLRFVIVALPGLFSYLFLKNHDFIHVNSTVAGKYNKHKQDGSHLGFPIRMILSTTDLQVTSILPMNFESFAL